MIDIKHLNIIVSKYKEARKTTTGSYVKKKRNAGQRDAGDNTDDWLMLCAKLQNAEAIHNIYQDMYVYTHFTTRNPCLACI